MLNVFCKGAAIVGFDPLKYCALIEKPSTELQQKFQQHLEEENLSFPTKEEFEYRFELFKQAEAEINEWNGKQSSFELGHNFFSTMTEEESSRLLGGAPEMDVGQEPTFIEESGIPASVNWVAAGGVNPIKNQGMCGSCWAFGSVSAVETSYWQTTGQKINLSEQQVVSCNTPPQNGCHGGWPVAAFEYMKYQGLTTTKNYPYGSGRSRQTGKCNKQKEAQGKVKITSWAQLNNTVSQHKAAISKNVVTSAIYVDNIFKRYRTGILDNAQCGWKVNHIVSLVGYGTWKGKDYYILRNQWGTRWGEKGYMKIAAHTDGNGICGIQRASFQVETAPVETG